MQLISAQKGTLRDLELANAKIKERIDVIEFSGDLQRTLVGSVLDDLGVDEIAKVAAEAFDTSVFIFDASAQLRAQCGDREGTVKDKSNTVFGGTMRSRSPLILNDFFKLECQL